MVETLTERYKKYYQEEIEKAYNYWTDKGRGSYEADVWYNRNRNDIGLSMLGDCRGQRVLDIGARMWIEKEFLEQLDCAEIVKTDIVGCIEENVIEADAHHLPFPDSSFDVVICREVIEHVHNAQQVLSEIHRVLKASGILHISTPNAYAIQPDGKTHLRAYSPKSFLKELQETGFKVIMKRGNVPFIFSTLLPLSQMGFKMVLPEFKEISHRIEGLEESYYIGVQMFVIAERLDDNKSSIKN